jgi:hypothetical protein
MSGTTFEVVTVTGDQPTLKGKPLFLVEEPSGGTTISSGVLIDSTVVAPTADSKGNDYAFGAVAEVVEIQGGVVSG